LIVSHTAPSALRCADVSYDSGAVSFFHRIGIVVPFGNPMQNPAAPCVFRTQAHRSDDL